MSDVQIAHFILYVKQSELDKRVIENEKEKMRVRACVRKTEIEREGGGEKICNI